MSTIQNLKKQFPLLNNYPDLIYLDSASTTQKPYTVINTIQHYYEYENTNIHRGNYQLARKNEETVHHTRTQTQQFIHAQEPEEIIFTSGTTHSINIIAQTYGQQHLQQGDNIIVSALEHHSNYLPWYHLAQEKNASLHIIPLNPQGTIDLHALKQTITPKTKIIAINYLSHVLGTINPIKEISQLAHQHNAVVVVDAAQAIPHLPIDVQNLNCDFLAFSAHKIYGPTGIGILYAKKQHLQDTPPYQYGGGIVQPWQPQQPPQYLPIPYRYESGTPNIASIIALKTTLDFIQTISYKTLQQHEKKLAQYLKEKLTSLPYLQFLGNIPPTHTIATFNLHNIHPLDLALNLDLHNIAVRAGSHCAQPLMHHLNTPSGGVRVSLAIYNTEQEIDTLTHTLHKIYTKYSSHTTPT